MRLYLPEYRSELRREIGGQCIWWAHLSVFCSGTKTIWWILVSRMISLLMHLTGGESNMTTRATKSAWTCFDNFGYHNVTQFPYYVPNDGVTNATAAILVAFAATTAPLYFPPGTYLIDPVALTSISNLQVSGAGHRTIFKLAAGSTAAALSFISCDRLELSNFLVDGNKAAVTGTGLHGIHITGGADTTLLGMELQDTLGHGIAFSPTGAGVVPTAVRIISPKIKGQVGNGINIGASGGIDILTPYIQAGDPSAYPGDGIAIYPDTVSTSSSLVTVRGGTVLGAVGRGIFIGGNGSQNAQGNTIEGTRVLSSGSHGIHLLRAANTSIVGAFSTLGAGDGIRLEGNTTNNTIVATTAAYNVSGTGMLEATSGATPDYNKFIGCNNNNNSSNVITLLGAHSVEL